MKKIFSLIALGLVAAVAYAEPTPEARALFKTQMEKAEHISPNDLAKALKSGEKLVLIDVRQKSERPITGSITAGDVHIPRGHLEMRAYTKLPERDANIVVYCGKGIRSAFAANTLNEMGYTNVRNLEGGTKAWKESGLPTLDVE